GHGKVTTGASNDIMRATQLARNMVTKWGMSDQLGPLMYGDEEEELFLGRSITQHKTVSPETAEMIDSEVRALIDRCYTASKQILVDHMDKLHTMAQALMKYETIDAIQIDAIMQGREVPPPADWNESDGPGDKPPRPITPIAPTTTPAAQT
ncbi:MAG: ATP-dependent metalloprotease, partial [Xanthomonadales bacterium]|nr:ATP-dependent metalloprotease [Xanthomonadales bacterium]